MVARIGVIGAGHFGEMHLRAFSQMEQRGTVKLVAVADIDPEVLERRRRHYRLETFTDYRDMLRNSELDGVAVATPDFLHREISIDCLSAGVHVLAEKPLDVTVEGCLEMIAAAKTNRRLLQVDFHKRFDASYRELKRLLAEGYLGAVEYGYAHMEDRIEVPRDWLCKWAERSSPNWFLGVHMYDLVRWITQDEVSRVSATGVKKKLLLMGLDTYDSIQAKLILKQGGSFSVDTSWVLPDGHESIVNQGFRLVGSDGMVELDSQYRGARGCLKTPVDSRPSKESGMQTWNLEFFRDTSRRGQASFGGYGIESIEDFAENVCHLLEGGSLESLEGYYADGQDGLAATRIASAVEESVKAGGCLIELDSM